MVTVGKSQQLRRIELKLYAKGEDVVRKIQLRAMQALRSGTPVDTGFARSGWTPSVGSPMAQALNRPATETAAKAAARKRASKHLAEAQKIAQTYKLRQGPAFISNATPYIGFLNGGSSAQAPKNFVERAIMLAIRSVARTA